MSSELSFPLSSAVLTTTLSIPAVFRPWLTCVTRLTANTMLDVELSISFCNWRTFRSLSSRSRPEDTTSQVIHDPVHGLPINGVPLHKAIL